MLKEKNNNNTGLHFVSAIVMMYLGQENIALHIFR